MTRPEGRSRAHAIPLGRKLLYSAVLVVGALLLCETALRIRAWMRYGTAGPSIRDPMVAYDPAADLYVPTPGYEVKGARLHIRINSLGFRGDEFSRQKPSNTVRIAILGASTTFNAEVSSNHATWPHRLQVKLRDAYPAVNIEVINAGVGGYVARDNLKSLRVRVLPLDPDLVIYYEANNEIVHDTRELALERGLIGRQRSSRLVAAMSSVSLMFDLFHKNLVILARGRGAATATLAAVPVDLPRRFLATLDEMRVELERHGVPFVLSTFIVKYRRDQDRATQIANADVAFYYMPWMSIEGMLDAMDVYNAAILEYATTHRLPVVDDRDAVPADEEHFADCMHVADKGADAMAERFYRFLRAEGLVEPLVRKAQASARLAAETP